MDSPLHGRWHWIALLAATALPAGTLLLIFFIRLWSTIEHGAYFDGIGFQNPNIYNIWKVQRGLPLYEWPDGGVCNVTLYNFLFYYAYAWATGVIGATSGEYLLAATRCLTALFAAGGAVSFYFTVRTITAPKSWQMSAVAAMLGFCSWFSFTPMYWWILSVRPDVLATFFATLGLWAYLSALQRRERWRFVLAGGAFFLAWATKQSTVAILAGCALDALLRRGRILEFVAFVMLPGAMMALVLLVGNENYWENTMRVPALFRFQWDLAALEMPINAAKYNAFLYFFGPAALLVRRLLPPQPVLDGTDLPLDALRPLLVCAAVAVPWNLLLCFREGASTNVILEASIILGLISTVSLVSLEDAIRKSLLLTGIVAYLILWLALPIERLVNRPSCVRLIHTQQEYERRRDIAKLVRTLPGPVFAEVGPAGWTTYALPWNSSGDEYPAVVPDTFWHNVMSREAYFTTGGLERLVKERWFRALVFERGGDWNYLVGVARGAGYEEISLPIKNGVQVEELMVLQLPEE